MLLIPCPWCGPRDEIEFRFLKASEHHDVLDNVGGRLPPMRVVPTRKPAPNAQLADQWLKPQIALSGDYGIPLRDELELEHDPAVGDDSAIR